jgi:hypothetical protein
MQIDIKILGLSFRLPGINNIGLLHLEYGSRLYKKKKMKYFWEANN